MGLSSRSIKQNVYGGIMKFFEFIIIEWQKRRYLHTRIRRFLLNCCSKVKIGNESTIQEQIHFRGYINIGNKCFINRGCIFQGGDSQTDSISIGDGVFVGFNVLFACGTHDIGDGKCRALPGYYKAINIGRGSWIGAGAIILPGITVGEGSIIGAGAVVTHDIPDNVIAVGVPAKVIKHLEYVIRES